MAAIMETLESMKEKTTILTEHFDNKELSPEFTEEMKKAIEVANYALTIVLNSPAVINSAGNGVYKQVLSILK